MDGWIKASMSLGTKNRDKLYTVLRMTSGVEEYCKDKVRRLRTDESFQGAVRHLQLSGTW